MCLKMYLYLKLFLLLLAQTLPTWAQTRQTVQNVCAPFGVGHSTLCFQLQNFNNINEEFGLLTSVGTLKLKARIFPNVKGFWDTLIPYDEPLYPIPVGPSVYFFFCFVILLCYYTTKFVHSFFEPLKRKLLLHPTTPKLPELPLYWLQQSKREQTLRREQRNTWAWLAHRFMLSPSDPLLGGLFETLNHTTWDDFAVPRDTWSLAMAVMKVNKLYVQVKKVQERKEKGELFEVKQQGPRESLKVGPFDKVPAGVVPEDYLGEIDVDMKEKKWKKAKGFGNFRTHHHHPLGQGPGHHGSASEKGRLSGEGGKGKGSMDKSRNSGQGHGHGKHPSLKRQSDEKKKGSHAQAHAPAQSQDPGPEGNAKEKEEPEPKARNEATAVETKPQEDVKQGSETETEDTFSRKPSDYLSMEDGGRGSDFQHDKALVAGVKAHKGRRDRGRKHTQQVPGLQIEGAFSRRSSLVPRGSARHDLARAASKSRLSRLNRKSSHRHEYEDLHHPEPKKSKSRANSAAAQDKEEKRSISSKRSKRSSSSSSGKGGGKETAHHHDEKGGKGRSRGKSKQKGRRPNEKGAEPETTKASGKGPEREREGKSGSQDGGQGHGLPEPERDRNKKTSEISENKRHSSDPNLKKTSVESKKSGPELDNATTAAPGSSPTGEAEGQEQEARKSSVQAEKPSVSTKKSEGDAAKSKSKEASTSGEKSKRRSSVKKSISNKELKEPEPAPQPQSKVLPNPEPEKEASSSGGENRPGQGTGAEGHITVRGNQDAEDDEMYHYPANSLNIKKHLDKKK